MLEYSLRITAKILTIKKVIKVPPIPKNKIYPIF
jgi:hypothetical protein